MKGAFGPSKKYSETLGKLKSGITAIDKCFRLRPGQRKLEPKVYFHSVLRFVFSMQHLHDGTLTCTEEKAKIVFLKKILDKIALIKAKSNNSNLNH